MSSCETTLPEACWAAMVVALLEQEQSLEPDVEAEAPQSARPGEERETTSAGGPDSPDAAETEPDAAARADPACEEEPALGDGPSAEKSPLGHRAEESFLSETTARLGRVHETPGTIEEDQSFQSDVTGQVLNSPFHLEDSFQTPPITRDRRSSPPGAFPSVPAADLARQHFEWAQELESVDQKQADLMMTQWKLIRNQTGMLAQQLVELRKEVDAVKHETRQSSQQLEKQSRENKDMQQRLGATLQQSVQETHMSLARLRTEVQKRASQESDAQRRLQSLESWAAPSLRKLECEVAELRCATDVSVKQVCQIKDQLLQQVDEWKAGHAVVMDHSTKWQDRVRKGLRAIMNAHESHRNEVQQLQQSMQETLDQKFQGKFDEAMRRVEECGAQKENSEDIENRLSDFEAMMDSEFQAQTQGMEHKWLEMESKFKDLENSDKLIKVSLNQEIAARHSMVEVFDQMLKTEASRIQSSVSEQVAVSHLDWKESQKTMLEHLSQETWDRQEQARAINADLASLGNGLGDRLSRLEGAWHSVRQDWREAKGHVRALQGQLKEVETSLDSGLQGLRAELQSSLREERLKQEVHGTGMCEQIQAWEDFHKHLRQFYMSHTTLPPGDARGVRDSEMSMGRLAELLRCSQDSEAEASFPAGLDLPGLRGPDEVDPRS